MLRRMRWLCGPILLLSLVLIFVPSISAAAGEIGLPGGGSVTAIAIDSRSLYIASEGVYKSINRGISWGSVNWLGRPTCLFIDPKNGNNVYAGAQRGIYISKDGGTSWMWSDTNRGLPWISIEAVATDPNDSNVVYVGTYGAGVFKSTDGGTSWNPINDGINNPNIMSLVVDHLNGNNIYISDGFGEIFKSSNAGGSWSMVNQSRGVLRLTMDPSNSHIIYAATVSGLIKTTNGGASWSYADNGLDGSAVTSLAIDPCQSQNLYGVTYNGVYMSADGGQLWAKISNGLSFLNGSTIVIDPNSTRTLFAATSNGLYKSTDGGDSWNAASNGGGTPVPVMEGLWFLPGILAGCGIFVNRYGKVRRLN